MADSSLDRFMFKSDNATVNLIKLLAPGFLALFVMSVIVDVGDTKEFNLIFYAFALTILCWALAYPILWLIVRATGTSVVWDLSNPLFLTYVTALSICLGVGLAIGIQRDILFTVLRGLPVTDVINKRSIKRPLPFLLSRNTAGGLRRDGDARPTGKVTEAWLRVRLKKGGAYEGWPEFYGLGPTESELYLSPACQVQTTPNQGEKISKHTGPGVLIYEREIEVIELIDRTESACFRQWFPDKK